MIVKKNKKIKNLLDGSLAFVINEIVQYWFPHKDIIITTVCT